MTYLALDTSTEYLSFALTTPTGAVTERHWKAGQKQAEWALPYLRTFLAEEGLPLATLKGIAFTQGPGAFTGLRIGAGLVQGLAFALNVPIVGVCSLKTLAQASGQNKVIAALDARMNELYCAAFEREEALSPWKTVIPPCLCSPSALPPLEGEGWTAVGSGAEAYQHVFETHYGQQLQTLQPNVFPSAAALLALAMPAFERGDTLTAEHLELAYVRNRVALKSSERAKP